MPSPPNKIIVSGDVFRPDKDGANPAQVANIRWLFKVLRPVLREATGLDVVVLDGTQDALRFGDLYRTASLQPTDDAWATLYAMLPDAVGEGVASAFDRSLVVGFELPPSVAAHLDAAGVPFVDLLIHPVRFMEDLLLAGRASFADGEAVLADRAMPARLAHRSAGLLEGLIERKPAFRPDLERPMPVFVAQMAVDRSMIRDGRLLRPADLETDIKDAVAGHDAIAFKPHPFEANAALRQAIADAGVRLVDVKTNIYALLTSDLITEVITLSSSVGSEAPFFGKPARHVIGPSTPVRYQGDDPNTVLGYWTLRDDFLVPDFWRDLLAPIMPVTAPDGDRPVPMADRLRTSMQMYWAYQDFANDLVIAQSSYGPVIETMRVSRRMKKTFALLDMVLNDPVAEWASGSRKVLRGELRAGSRERKP